MSAGDEKSPISVRKNSVRSAEDLDLNGWNTDLENAIKYIGDCAQGYLWMYQRDKRWYNKLYIWSRWVIVFVIISSAFFSTLGLGLGVNDNAILVVIGTVLSAISAAAYAGMNSMDFTAKIDLLRHHTAKVSALVHNIKRQLSMERKDRENAGSYMFWITRSYNELIELGPPIMESSQLEYEKLATAAGLPFPEGLNVSAIAPIKVTPSVVGGAPATEDLPFVHVEESSEPKNPVVKHVIKPLPPTKAQTDEITRKTLRNLNSNLGGILSDALVFSDAHMKYEMERLNAK